MFFVLDSHLYISVTEIPFHIVIRQQQCSVIKNFPITFCSFQNLNAIKVTAWESGKLWDISGTFLPNGHSYACRTSATMFPMDFYLVISLQNQAKFIGITGFLLSWLRLPGRKSVVQAQHFCFGSFCPQKHSSLHYHVFLNGWQLFKWFQNLNVTKKQLSRIVINNTYPDC